MGKRLVKKSGAFIITIIAVIAVLFIVELDVVIICSPFSYSNYSAQFH